MALITPNIRKQITHLTDWWEDVGVPVDRREIERLIREANSDKAQAASQATAADAASTDHVQNAMRLAKGAKTLEELKSAIESFDGCELKSGATNTVFSDGTPAGGVMIIGEGPAREEDATGKPFVGKAGVLLDNMLASIGLSRNENAYITNVNFWRPPGNRNPSDEELALCRPFVHRHIQLAAPKLIIVTGAVPAKALLNTNQGIMKLRGNEFALKIDEMEDIPLCPIFHPAYLLRRPAEKARAWADLLKISSRLIDLGIAPDKRP